MFNFATHTGSYTSPTCLLFFARNAGRHTTPPYPAMAPHRRSPAPTDFPPRASPAPPAAAAAATATATAAVALFYLSS